MLACTYYLMTVVPPYCSAEKEPRRFISEYGRGSAAGGIAWNSADSGRGLWLIAETSGTVAFVGSEAATKHEYAIRTLVPMDSLEDIRRLFVAGSASEFT